MHEKGAGRPGVTDAVGELAGVPVGAPERDALGLALSLAPDAVARIEPPVASADAVAAAEAAAEALDRGVADAAADDDGDARALGDAAPVRVVVVEPLTLLVTE